MNNYKYFKCFDGPSESWFCWMFLLFLFKSKTRQRKSLGLPLTNYNINPHQHVSELFCIFRCGFSYLVIHSRKTPTLHSNTCIWEASGLVVDYTYTCCLQREAKQLTQPSHQSLSLDDLDIWVKLAGHIAG